MVDPIILSSGHTYEWKVIAECFSRNGYKDPVTSETVSERFVENILLRHAIEDFT